MSKFLFLLCLDWVTRKATASKRRGIRWNFTTVLEDLDFADEISLLSSKFNNLHKKTGGVSSQSRNKKVNARKCKTLRTERACNREKTVVDGEEVDDVEEFTFLGAILDREGGGSKDIMQVCRKHVAHSRD
ncbi:uncharacterized protein [Porites lutea]|uniref:uncharacterized protein n=1 Tax=Porites lutea TaxID=51062 RepID=UPI003CC51531